MSGEEGSGKQQVKNSLLSAAASGFSFEDSVDLLVPVSLQDESEFELVSSEIDLGEELAEELDKRIETVTPVPVSGGGAGQPLISLFSKAALESDDPFSAMRTEPPDPPPPPRVEDWRPERSHPAHIFLRPSSPPTSTEGLSVGQVLMATQGALPPTRGSTEAVPVPDVSSFPYSASSPDLSAQATGKVGNMSVTDFVRANSVMLPPPPPPGPPPFVNAYRIANQRPAYVPYPGLSVAQSKAYNVSQIPPIFMDPPVTETPVMKFVPTSADNFVPDDSGYYKKRWGKPDVFDGQGRIGTFSVPSGTSGRSFIPVSYHWFYRKDADGRQLWKPFSLMDSVVLEDAFLRNVEGLVATDGGRYDVDVRKRQKVPIYWEEEPSEVRRCSWFYKGPMDSRFVPYDEELSRRLESEFEQAVITGVWHKRLEFPGGEAIILHNPNAMAHFCQAAAPDEWGNLPENQIRPRVVKRGVEDFEIDDGESKQIDHLVFLVHGIGAICDFKFRTIVEAVDDFRGLSVQLMQSHFKDSVDVGRAGRIEFLPVSWHKALHGDGGIDQKLKPITLKSIPKLRNFTNDTLLDILFYTSPVYAQAIVDTVGNELNRLFNLFLTRNPTFNGYVALSGHSLGSLILFDLLSHQPEIGRQRKRSGNKAVDNANDLLEAPQTSNKKSRSRMVSYTIGNGTGQPVITYPTLEFEPTAFFALGSPIAMFVTVRGIDKLGEDFHFPTCPAFFNIFHPYDPVAYRIETLIDQNTDARPVVIPHHKGRKRLHLELKETMQRVGSDIKQKFLDSVKTTWNTVYQLATFSKGENFEQEMDRVIEKELVKKSEETASNASGSDDVDQDVGLGKLNGGRRIDYVLQEAPLESFNEYLFALSSHVCYWESEDTMLMIMKEIYASMGIYPDSVKKPTSRSYSPAYLVSPEETHTSPFVPVAPSSAKIGEASSVFTPSAPNGGQLYSNPMTATAPGPPPLLFNTNTTESNTNWASPPIGAPALAAPMPGKPPIIGARPVISPEMLSDLRGMDPTAPIASASSVVGPPPLHGFIRKN